MLLLAGDAPGPRAIPARDPWAATGAGVVAMLASADGLLLLLVLLLLLGRTAAHDVASLPLSRIGL